MLRYRTVRRCFGFLFLGLAAAGVSAPAGAQGLRPEQGAAIRAEPRKADPFVVTGIPVDATAESAAAARPVAIGEGQRRAFLALMRRLTRPEDHGRLPRPSEALLNQTVAGFEIDEERTSATRYIARITVRFRADEVRRLLQDARLPYSETVSRPVLVIPVWQTATESKLWEADNPWRVAWQSRPEADGLVPLIAAPADADAPPLQQLLGNPENLRAYADKLGYQDALVVSATLQRAEPGNVRVDMHPYHSGPAAFLERLDAFTATGGTQEEALLSGALDLSRRIETRWKMDTVIDPEKQGQLSAAAAFAGLPEWNRLRSTLAAMPLVRHFEVLHLSHRDAQLQIEFYGDPGQLSTALAQRDIVLEQRDGFWQIRSRQP
ncbi:MAG TPA: DUF2066 domain-containing protein [Ferrovibrio sp.]|jgi:hypothetical protein|uniref:DUF2066 domain-containing protein n=1 Tax=Ferrovibrio sp. TaxID=1917215 RepID=UPI002B4B5A3D|nr:DUF2066 domain-containing protein [Ferrovibrio sp.]HLT77872.1 DUF2066 domain-containing protein [Ferrovibrio sp.]